jgi:hypothetical protein
MPHAPCPQTENAVPYANEKRHNVRHRSRSGFEGVGDGRGSTQTSPKHDFIWVGGVLRGIAQMFIDTPRQIAETLYFSLRCVDALQGEGLRYVFGSIFGRIC